MQIWTRKDKNGEPYYDDLEKSSSDESDSESDDEKIMMNLANNLLKAKKSILITKKPNSVC